jgi:hypothetical protein
MCRIVLGRDQLLRNSSDLLEAIFLQCLDNVTRSLISVPGMCNGCVFVRKGFDVLQEITFTRAFNMKGFLTTALVLIGLNMQL